jgi:hypothetical protein
MASPASGRYNTRAPAKSGWNISRCWTGMSAASEEAEARQEGTGAYPALPLAAHRVHYQHGEEGGAAARSHHSSGTDQFTGKNRKAHCRKNSASEVCNGRECQTALRRRAIGISADSAQAPTNGKQTESRRPQPSARLAAMARRRGPAPAAKGQQRDIGSNGKQNADSLVYTASAAQTSQRNIRTGGGRCGNIPMWPARRTRRRTWPAGRSGRPPRRRFPRAIRAAQIAAPRRMPPDAASPAASPAGTPGKCWPHARPRSTSASE